MMPINDFAITDFKVRHPAGLSFKLEKAHFDALTKLADSRGVPISVEVRRAMRLHLEAHSRQEKEEPEAA
jgi:hypothetical protein